MIALLLMMAIVFTSINYPKLLKKVEAQSNRDIVYNYMQSMESVTWKATSTFYTTNGTTYTSGRTYKGIPYSQRTNNNKLINLEAFEQYGNRVGYDIGRNDCSSTVCMSWRKVGFQHISISACMYPGNLGIKAVGNYTWKGSHAATCTENGRDKMYAAYAKVKKGDALVQNGHVRMVRGVSNGKVQCLEQTGGLDYSKDWLRNNTGNIGCR